MLATLIDPDHYRTRWRWIFGSDVGRDRDRLLPGRGDPRLEALARPRLLPLPAFRVRQGPVRARARRLSGRAVEAPQRVSHDAHRARARFDPDLPRLPPARLRHGARVLRGRRRSALRRRDALDAHRRARGAGVVALPCSSSACSPPPACRFSRTTSSSGSRASSIPDQDPGGTTYNITQSKNAIGAGQLRGRGVDNATQTTLNFLPEHHTDFVFASLAEERGFFGASLLLMLYLLVVWRGLRIVTLAREPFSAIVAGGLVFSLLFQIFVNVGMTMGIAPITGHPAPVRERRRLVDDREPDRGRDPAVDLGPRRAAAQLAPGARPLRPPASACPGAS